MALGLNAVSPHNPVVMGNYLYVSWYQAGLQIFDISNPSNPVRVGQYDTYQPAFTQPELTEQTKALIENEPWDVYCGSSNRNSALPNTFDGNWAVYPFLGTDKILTGDLTYGLQILDVTKIAAPNKNRVSDFDGRVRLVAPPGESHRQTLAHRPDPLRRHRQRVRIRRADPGETRGGR